MQAAGLAGEPDRLPGGLEVVRGRRARVEGGLIQHYYYFLATDSVGQAVLDGQVINLALTAITGGATITGNFGSNTGAAGALVSGVTTNETRGWIPPTTTAERLDYSILETLGNHGVIGLGITTKIGTPASGTITVSVIGFGATTVSISFVASGAGAALAISTPAAGDASGNLGANFEAAEWSGLRRFADGFGWCGSLGRRCRECCHPR